MAGITPQNRGNKTTSRLGAVISRKLKKEGWNISPAARRHKADGIFVRATGDYVSVLVDLGANSHIHADRLAGTVCGWDKASGVTITPGDGYATVRFTYGA